MLIKNKSFKESLRRLFIAYTFIPVVILFLLFFLFTVYISKRTIVSDTNKAAKILSETMSDVYQNYEEEIEQMIASPAVLNYVKTRLHSAAVYERFYQFNSMQDVKSTFYMIDTDGIYIAHSDRLDPKITDPHEEIVARIERNNGETLTETNYLQFTSGRNTVYTFGRAIIDEGETLGYIIYHLLEHDLQNLLFIKGNEIALVTDEHNSILSTSNNSTRARLNKFNPKYNDKGYIETAQGPYYMSKIHPPQTQFSVYTLNSINYSKDVYIYLLIFLVSTSLILWLLIHKLANRMSTRHTESIDKLLYAVNELKDGNMAARVDIHTGDEFEVLANQYNVMLDRLNDLMIQNKETSNVKRMIELKKLQTQFNPHFIFNILETLRYAVHVDVEKAKKIILKLSRLLRYSINNDGYKILLKDDINYIIDYLDLQHIRFNDRLRYKINIPEQLFQCFVPKLLIQPLIENAIKHGFKHQEHLMIEVTGRVVAGDLILQVHDNGKGISPDKLKEIRELMVRQENISEHIGLYNIHRQLKLLYGDTYGIHIESKDGMGTIVTIDIPYEKDDNDV